MSSEFANNTDAELRQYFEDCKGHAGILRAIHDELASRTTKAARQLQSEVQATIDALENRTSAASQLFEPLAWNSPQARAAAPKIAELRQQLLDLSNRNRLLNFKHTPSGGRYVRVVDESPEAIFAQLHDGEKVELVALPDPPDELEDENTEEFRAAFEQALLTDRTYLKAAKEISELRADDAEAKLRIAQRQLRDRLRRKLGLADRIQGSLSLRDYAAKLGIRPDYDLSGRGHRSMRRKTQWQTLMGYDELASRLRGIEQAAREAQQEFGIETLYFVFGFLEWYPPAPDGEAEGMLLSPLLLQLTNIEKRRNAPGRPRGPRLLEQETGGLSTSGRESYILTATDAEEPSVNLTLRERLRADHNLLLPEFDPDEFDLAGYFEKVERAIRPFPNWRLRRFVTLTHLSFSRLPMWRDLDPSNSNTLPPHLHPVVGEMFGGRTADPVDAEEEESERRASAPVLVLDADSSQQDAIIQALSGRNLVVQGPPGTGKSQTIANLIAAAMGQGKSVLFVAEKQVALQAVYKRLAEQAKLGDFILELHSAKAGKKPVIESIRKRLERRSRSVRTQEEKSQRQHHAKSAEGLNAYAEAMNSPFGQLGWTIHDLVWRHLNQFNAPLPPALQSFEFDKADEWNNHDWSARRDAIKEWAELDARRSREPVDGEGRHMWHWVLADDVFVSDQARILSHSGKLLTHVDELQRFLTETEFGKPSSAPAEISKLANRLRQLGDRPANVRAGLWALAVHPSSAESVNAVVAAQERVDKAREIVAATAPQLLEMEKDPVSAIGRFGELLKSLSAWQPVDSVEHLPERIVATEAWISVLPKATEILQGLAALAGPNVTFDTIQSVQAAANLLDLAASLPVAAAGRSMAWAEDQAVSVLRTAIAQAQALRTVREQLRARTEYPFEELSSEDVQTAVKQLEKGWLASWLFSPSYRAARRLAQKVAPGKGIPHAVNLLSDIGKFLEQRSALQAHTAKTITGGLFEGMDSDLEALCALADWVERVRTATPILPAVNVAIRSLLFAQRRDLHELAKSLVADSWPQCLRDLARLGETATGWNKLSAFLQHELSVLQSASAYTTNWNWKGSLSDDARHRVKAALIQIGKAQAVLSKHQEITTLLLPDIAPASQEFTAAHASVQRVRATGLPKKLQEKLVSEEGAVEWQEVAKRAAALRTKLAHFENELSGLAALAGFADSLEEDWMSVSLEDLRIRLSTALAAESALPTRCGLLAIHSTLEKLGISSFVKVIQSLQNVHAEAVKLLDGIFIRTLCNLAFEKVPAVKPFRHSSPEVLRRKFREADQALKELDRNVLAASLLQKHIPAGNGVGPVRERTELALLEYVCGLQAPRTPVRDLLRRSTKALQALKPSFMMSPLSVAQLVDRNAVSFDLVVFDEASQIRPEDALSALTRARQFVVVGDSMQLPPTSFGMKSADTPDLDEEAEEDESAVVESILELAAAAYGNGPTLTWHYRSRDPSLIAYSNKEFYERKLRLFPAPFQKAADSGIHYVPVGGVYSARTNLIEAQQCAAAAIEFMRAYPRRSLGIVALNRPQADLIEVELDRLIAKESAAIEYCERWQDSIEPLFVKNLESVQGDERDVIFISTVFGNDDEGKFFQRFGPINSKAGHRRLNVLFTRAKHQVIVFSSIPESKILAEERTHWGVRVLKEYLSFARSGRLESGLATGRPTESPFEDAVLAALKPEGFQCVPQVGVAGFFIDLAVRHPAYPDHFTIGIECDGAAYHRNREARDRDRLRQEILESLGWQIYRVWSTDWFANPRAELQKLVRAVRQSIESYSPGAKRRPLSFLRTDSESN
jgi:very-short-patch-repair endonuclease